MSAQPTISAEKLDGWRAPELDEFPELDRWEGPWQVEVWDRPTDHDRTARLADVDVPIGASGGKKPWEGSSSGLPINRARADRKTTSVWNASRPALPFPITKLPLPTPARREGDPVPATGHDAHLLLVDGVTERCWEGIRADHGIGARLRSLLQCDWTVGYTGSSTGLIGWDMSRRWTPSTAPKGGTIAISTPLTPLVVRAEELARGHISHCLAIVLPNYGPGKPVGWARGTDGTDPASPLRAGDILALPCDTYLQLIEEWPVGTAERALVDALWRHGGIVSDKRTTGRSDQGSAAIRMAMDHRIADLDDLGLRLTSLRVVQPLTYT